MHLKPLKSVREEAEADPLIAIAGGGGVDLFNSKEEVVDPERSAAPSLPLAQNEKAPQRPPETSMSAPVT
jgi:hypothetical protein